MLVLSTVFWGLSFPLIKATALAESRLLPQAGGGFVVAGLLAPRFLLALPLLFAWLLASRRADRPLVRREELRQGLVVGLFAAAGMLLQNDGLRFTAASTSAFLTQLYAITIPLWIAVRSRRLPPMIVWACCIMVLAGVAILGRFNWQELRFGRGELETLLCSMFFMGQILWLEYPSFADNRALPMTVVMFVVEAVVFSVLGVLTAPGWTALFAPWHSRGWVEFTVLLAGACTLVPYLLMNVWQPKISATEAGLIYCAEPVFGTLLSFFLPAWFSRVGGIAYADERAGFSLVVGGSLILAANLLIQLRPPRPDAPAGSTAGLGS